MSNAKGKRLKLSLIHSGMIAYKEFQAIKCHMPTLVLAVDKVNLKTVL